MTRTSQNRSSELYLPDLFWYNSRHLTKIIPEYCLMRMIEQTYPAEGLRCEVTTA